MTSAHEVKLVRQYRDLSRRLKNLEKELAIARRRRDSEAETGILSSISAAQKSRTDIKRKIQGIRGNA